MNIWDKYTQKEKIGFGVMAKYIKLKIKKQETM